MREFWRRLSALVRPDALDRTVSEELQFHADMKMRETGNAPAARALGGQLVWRERARDAWGWRWLDDLLWDVRYALRIFRQNPTFTAVALIMLGVGVGINAAVFTITNAVLFKGFPAVTQNDRIVYVDTRRNGQGCCVSYPDFLEWRAQARSFKGMGAVADRQIMLSDGGRNPEHDDAAVISANAFALLGVQPLLGRDFLPSDERAGAAPVAMLRYAFWQRRYGGDPSIVGRTVLIDGVPTTVIGVMPQRFSFPENLDLWIPLVPTPSLLNRKTGLWLAFGRLADGVSVEGARAELDTIGRRLATAFRSTNTGVVPVVHTFDDFFIGPNATAIYAALLGAVGFVLLIACANVANLLLGRAVARSREIAVRVALGAARSRIIRQLLIETLTLSVGGGALGWLIAKWSLRLYELATVPSGQFIGGSWFDHVLDFGLDTRGLAYLIVLSLATGVLFGVAPAVRLSRLADGVRLKDGGRGATASSRARRQSLLLVAAETALAIMLLAGAGVLVRSFINLSRTNVGVNTDHLLAMLVRLGDNTYSEADSQIQVYDRLSRRLASIAGVESVAIASSPPAGGASMRVNYEFADGPPAVEQRRPTLFGVTVTPGYFATMGAAVLAGREFEEFDGPTAPAVALVNQRFVDDHWPGQAAVGRRLRLFENGAPGPWLTVVGVVSNIAQSPITLQRLDPLLYLPLAQHLTSGAWVLARTSIEPAGLVSSFRQEVPKIDPSLVVWLGPFPLADRLAASYAFNRVISVLALVFAGIALLLAVIGIYAVLSHFVDQRTQEIGVRIAMGATTRQMLMFVFSRGMPAVFGGVVLGLAGAALVNRVLSAVLVKVGPVDPLTLVTASVVLLVAATIGCAVPAARAIAVDPVVALRHE